MLNEEFIKEIYEGVVNTGLDIYKELFEKCSIDNNTIDYWKKALKFYNSLEFEQKETLYSILKQTIIDTTANIFGILDGSVTLSEKDYDINITINGESTDDNLQDSFLLLAEELESEIG